jgi:hypothetical protein
VTDKEWGRTSPLWVSANEARTDYLWNRRNNPEIPDHAVIKAANIVEGSGEWGLTQRTHYGWYTIEGWSLEQLMGDSGIIGKVWIDEDGMDHAESVPTCGLHSGLCGPNGSGCVP